MMVRLSRNQKFCLSLGAIVVGLTGLYLSPNYATRSARDYASRLPGVLDKKQVEHSLHHSLAGGIPLVASTSDDDSAAQPWQLSLQNVEGSLNYNEAADIGASFRQSPLDPNVKVVILFSYMRSGSSFMGELLFDVDNNTFYSFEILEPLYRAMYGLAADAVIDTDLIFWSNGTRRKFPRAEVDAITWMLSNYLSCSMTSLPVQVYGHKFWHWSNNLKTFRACETNHTLTKRSRSCQNHIQPVCGRRFAERHSDVDLCFRKLWTPFWRKIHNISSAQNPDEPDMNSTHDKLFNQHDACLDALSDDVRACRPYLQSSCRKATLRATKLVRGSMETLEDLLDLMPNLYVIHLYRDPRAVIRSRRKIDWSKGHYDGDDLAKLAETYCRRVAMDARSREALLKKYPDRLLEVVYDKVVESPLPSLRRIFQFLDMEIPLQTLAKLEATTDELSAYKEKWTHEMTKAEIATIEKSCEEFTNATDFDWRHFDAPS